MKKILFSVLAAISALSAFAQADTAYAKEATSLKYKAEPNRFGVEAGISLKDGFSFKDKEEYDKGFKSGRINAIYSLSEQLSVRCGFGLEVKKTYTHKDTFTEHEGEEGKYETEVDTTTREIKTKFEVLPGIVYSFKGTDRLEPYVGAELVFGFDKERTRGNGEHSGNKGDGERAKEDKLNYTASKKDLTTNELHFGANGFTGFNFYLCKDLFIGAELKFGFITTPSITNDPASWEDSRYTQEEKKDDKNKNFNHTTDFNFLFDPSIRLGWKF